MLDWLTSHRFERRHIESLRFSLTRFPHEMFVHTNPTKQRAQVAYTRYKDGGSKCTASNVLYLPVYDVLSLVRYKIELLRIRPDDLTTIVFYHFETFETPHAIDRRR